MKNLIYVSENSIRFYKIEGAFKNKNVKLLESIDNYRSLSKQELNESIVNFVGDKRFNVLFDGSDVILKVKDAPPVNNKELKSYFLNNLKKFFPVDGPEYKYTCSRLNKQSMFTSALRITDCFKALTDNALLYNIDCMSLGVLPMYNFAHGKEPVCIYLFDGDSVITYIFDEESLHLYTTHSYDCMSPTIFESHHMNINTAYSRNHQGNSINSIYIINCDEFKIYKEAIMADKLVITDLSLELVLDQYITEAYKPSTLNFCTNVEGHSKLTKYTRNAYKLFILCFTLLLFTVIGVESWGYLMCKYLDNRDVSIQVSSQLKENDNLKQEYNKVTTTYNDLKATLDKPSQYDNVINSYIDTNKRLQDLANAVSEPGKVSAIKILPDSLIVHIQLNCDTQTALSVIQHINESGFYEPIELNRVILHSPTPDFIVNLKYKQR